MTAVDQKEVDTSRPGVFFLSASGGGNAKDLRRAQSPQGDGDWRSPTSSSKCGELTVPAEGSCLLSTSPCPTTSKRIATFGSLKREPNLSVVHHIVMYARDPAEQARQRGAQGRKFNIADGILGALSPGQTPFIANPGQAKLIKAGSQLVFQMHYTPNGKESKDRSIVGLIFAKGRSKRSDSKAAFDVRFAIPPG